METFSDVINIKNGVKLYKRDLIQLEELMKNGDSDSDSDIDYGDPRMNEFMKENVFQYSINYLRDEKRARKTFQSISELTSEYENIELESIKIVKQQFANSSVKRVIELVFTKHHAYGQIISDDIIWLQSKTLLLEDFFKRRQLKSGKYNTWVSDRLYIYSGVIAGGLAGVGIATEVYLLIIIAGFLLITSAVISYPKIRNTLFPKIQIRFGEKPNVKKENKFFEKYGKPGMFAIICSLIASFIFYYIAIGFLE